MKKLLLLTTFLLLSILSVYGQSALILGVEAGGNLGKIKTTGDYALDGQNESGSFGYQGGIRAGVKFGGFSILTGLTYKRLAGKITTSRNDPNNPWIFNNGGTLVADVGELTERYKYSCLDIPITLRYEFGQDFKVSLAAGLAFNIGMGKFTSEQTFNLTNNGEIGPKEVEFSYGKIGSDLIKNSWLSFQFAPGVIYVLNRSSRITCNVMFESNGKINNPNYLFTDEAGNYYKASGSIKSSDVRLQIGYEHTIGFKAGTKY